jgi:hypothetical protein
MLPELQKFLTACNNLEAIESVTTEDATPVMLAQVARSFTLSKVPTVFHFMVKDSTGQAQPVDIVIPFEIYSKLDGPPVNSLIAQADRHSEVAAYGIRFVHVDGSNAYPLVGHEWEPVENPPEELVSLLNQLDEIPDTDKVSAHNVVDPELIAKTGKDNAVRIVITLKHFSDHDTDRSGYHHDYCNFILAREIYTDVAHHPDIIENAKSSIATILAKEKLC